MASPVIIIPKLIKGFANTANPAAVAVRPIKAPSPSTVLTSSDFKTHVIVKNTITARKIDPIASTKCPVARNTTNNGTPNNNNHPILYLPCIVILILLGSNNQQTPKMAIPHNPRQVTTGPKKIPARTIPKNNITMFYPPLITIIPICIITVFRAKLRSIRGEVKKVKTL